MSGSAGLPSSKKTRRERSMLKGRSLNSRKECAGRVAGWAVFIARISWWALRYKQCSIDDLKNQDREKEGRREQASYNNTGCWKSNGWLYPQVGGIGYCLRAEKTWSQKNVCKTLRIPCQVHLRRTRTSSFRKETGAQWEYTASGRLISRTKQWRRASCRSPAVHLGFRSQWSIDWWRAPWRHDPV